LTNKNLFKLGHKTATTQNLPMQRDDHKVAFFVHMPIEAKQSSIITHAPELELPFLRRVELPPLKEDVNDYLARSMVGSGSGLFSGVLANMILDSIISGLTKWTKIRIAGLSTLGGVIVGLGVGWHVSSKIKRLKQKPRFFE
jgi:hypothetical protein